MNEYDGNDSRSAIEPRVPVEWLDYDAGAADWADVVRYPSRAIGATEWAALPDLSTGDLQHAKALKWLRKLQSLSPPSRRCPRLFIAHLAADRLAALKIARIASECGFHFWLDVLDPVVKCLPPEVGPMVATSAVIEMGMLNCTHVIAIGNRSPWIPYAFGRIRSRAAYSWQTGSWLASGSEALGLGVETHNKREIQDWLLGEFAMTLGCPKRLAVEWPDQPEITNELP